MRYPLARTHPACAGAKVTQTGIHELDQVERIIAAGGFGLASLRARATRLGGQLEMRTAAGRGTQVIPRLPAAAA